MLDATESPTLTGVLSESLKRQILALQDYCLLVARSLSNLFSPPWYWTDTLTQMDNIGVGSLPIVLTTGFFIGVVMVLQTSAQFQRFGETALTGDAVALALVRELGPTITALLVAGRNASGIASELGSMVVTEQVDAMRALGTDPYRKLVTPRVIATIAMLPLLTAVADFVGLVGGFLVSYFQLRLSPSEFWHTRDQRAGFRRSGAGNFEAGGLWPDPSDSRLLPRSKSPRRDARSRPRHDNGSRGGVGDGDCGRHFPLENFPIHFQFLKVAIAFVPPTSLPALFRRKFSQGCGRASRARPQNM